tara:strand:- start:1062 stop:1172 length:111 start_codon:yes stop_codon:yes gene_type:complete
VPQTGEPETPAVSETEQDVEGALVIEGIDVEAGHWA